MSTSSIAKPTRLTRWMVTFEDDCAVCCNGRGMDGAKGLERPITAGLTNGLPTAGCCPWQQNTSGSVQSYNYETTDWRAGCGRSASPVRREGQGSIPCPYPYHQELRYAPSWRPPDSPCDALTRRAGASSFARMSRLPFELLLALRYLRPKRTFVSVITSISVLGVTLGVAVLIIVISVMSGFDHQLRDKILGFNTHIKVLPLDETMKDYAAVARRVASNRNVKAVAPFVLGPVLVETEPSSGQSKAGAPWIRGINPQLEANMSELPSSIVEGKFDVSNQGLLIGTEFAHNIDRKSTRLNSSH